MVLYVQTMLAIMEPNTINHAAIEYILISLMERILKQQDAGIKNPIIIVKDDPTILHIIATPGTVTAIMKPKVTSRSVESK